MLNMLFKFVFMLITKIADLLLTPLVTALVFYFPALDTAFNVIYTYCDTVFNLIPLILDLMLVPRATVIFLMDYFVIKYSIYVVRKVFNFAVNCYNYFKP